MQQSIEIIFPAIGHFVSYIRSPIYRLIGRKLNVYRKKQTSNLCSLINGLKLCVRTTVNKPHETSLAEDFILSTL